MNHPTTHVRGPTPPLLPALALWGWETELLPWALGMGVIIEALRFAKLRFEIRHDDFHRLWNFTVLLFLGVALYLFLARQGLGMVGEIVTTTSPAARLEGMRQISQTAIMLLRWLPFVFAPFMLAHALSGTPTLPLSTFSFRPMAQEAQALAAGAPVGASGGIHPGYLYLTLVLFASCASTARSALHLPLFLGVVAWALWPWRSRRYRAWAWVGMFLVLLGASLVAQQGLDRLRQAWSSVETRLFQGVGQGRLDQIRASTALGAVGRLKQSGRIVLRVRTADGVAPGLLREAAFNRFRANAWMTSHRDFQTVGAPVDGHIWRLAEGTGRGRIVAIARYTRQGDAPVALPGDTMAISDLPALAVETNYLASTRMREGPPLALYSVEHGEGGGFDGPPEPDDTNLDGLSKPDREAVLETAQALGLAGQAPEIAVAAVERYFATSFEYTRWQRGAVAHKNTSAVARFLRETRAGHCEYFATATALLLRVAGIPARYAVGFSPGELRGEDWLARGRDAHAWCRAYIDGQWRDIDTTPGTWRQKEAAGAGWFEGVSDGFSQAWYRFALWRQRGGNWRLFVFAAGMLILAWLGWRQIRGSRWRRSRDERPAAAQRSPAPPGLDSEFFAVARHLERRYGLRLPHETLRAWVQRLALRDTPIAPTLDEALRLHYRLRFDPRGLPKTDRARLRVLALDLTGGDGRTILGWRPRGRQMSMRH